MNPDILIVEDSTPRSRRIRLIVGGFVLLAGLAAIAAVIYEVKAVRSEVGMLAFGLLFSTIGLSYATAFRRHLIDRDSKVVRSQSRVVGFCWRSSQAPLADFDAVSLSWEMRSSRSSDRKSGRSFVVYPVRLTGAAMLELMAPGDPAEARRVGERIAHFLNWPVRDTSIDGVESIRRPDELDIGIRERFARTRKRVKLPKAPETSRVRVTNTGRGVSLRIQGPGLGQYDRIILATIGVIALVLTDKFLSGGQAIGSWDLPSLVLTGAVPLVLLVLIVARFAPIQLKVDGGTLTFRRGAGLLERWTMASKDIEDLLVGGELIIVVSDHRRAEIRVPGKGADDAEYVYQTLLHFICR